MYRIEEKCHVLEQLLQQQLKFFLQCKDAASGGGQTKDIRQRLKNDVKFCDLKDVRYHFLAAEANVTICVCIPCWDTISHKGGDNAVEEHYSAWSQPGPHADGHSVVLKLDLNAYAAGAHTAEADFTKIAHIVFNILPAPLAWATAHASDSGVQPLSLAWKPEDRSWLVPGSGQVLIFYRMGFYSADDVTLVTVFLSQLASRSSGATPTPVLLSSPPDWYSAPSGPEGSAQIAVWVRIAYSPEHLTRVYRGEGTMAPGQRQFLAMMFRDFLIYHLKCTKTYMHTRIRFRVAAGVKGLEESKPVRPKERRAWGGKRIQAPR